MTDQNDAGTPAIPSRHETPLHTPGMQPGPGAPAAPPAPPSPAAPRPQVERRRKGWSEFRRAYPGILATMAIAFVVMLAADAWLVYKRNYYVTEIDRLRSGMSDAERKQADAVIATERNKLRVAVELIRRQAQGDKDLHVSIEVDSGRMLLEQDGALLREMPVQVAPEKVIGAGPDTVRMTPPRGARTVEKILDGGSWEVPKWVYTDRGLEVPADRSVKGALGPVAILLSGGTVVYSLPADGPLADPAYVLPGSIRARPADLRAIVPNLKAGSTVYLY
ncbi:MAG: hypothetical protein HOQ26_06705 [Gemmatimonadaceae bacterium]|nr:hypothetical protein [Gemmatimonadaceae bacterium]NUQ92586.1 hypothetical protein [Gemmatimonadaceae bacterium]